MSFLGRKNQTSTKMAGKSTSRRHGFCCICHNKSHIIFYIFLNKKLDERHKRSLTGPLTIALLCFGLRTSPFRLWFRSLGFFIIFSYILFIIS